MTLLIAHLSFVFGELAPQRLARQHPVAFTRSLAPGLTVLASIMRSILPLPGSISVLNASTTMRRQNQQIAFLLEVEVDGAHCPISALYASRATAA